MSKTKYQKYEIITIPRNKINLAFYNPRKISESNRKKLKQILKKDGLLLPLLWNEQTGNLVAGHQRITIIDQLEKSENYQIEVAKINVDEKKEAELNIKMNNTNLMGEWDEEKLEQIFSEFQLDPIKDLKFDKLDLDHMGIDNIFESHNTNNKENEKIDPVLGNVIDLKEQRNNYRKDQKKQKEIEGESIYGEQNDYILTIVFNTNLEKQNFCAAIGTDRKNKMIKYNQISNFLKENIKI